jgi:23S rRNA pseudouridine2605 synthase
LQVIMREGRKRQIREVGTRLGLPVVKIIRIRIGTLKLGNLKPREWRHLTSQEVAGLRAPTSQKVQPGRSKSGLMKAGAKPKKSGESGRSLRPLEKDKRR